MSATFKLFLPSGVEVLIPVKDFLEQDPANIFETMTLLSQKAMLAGFLATNVQTTLGQGENKEEIGWAVRTTTLGGKFGPTPAIHLYSTRPTYSKAFIVAYINSGDDLIAFEQVSGLHLAEMPEFVGGGRIERGKNPAADRMVMKFTRPAMAIWGPNPQYDQAAAAAATTNNPYKVAKKKFLRWDGVVPVKQVQTQPATTTAPQTTTQLPLKEVSREEFNDLLDGLRNAKTSRNPMESLKNANDAGNKQAARFSKYQREVFQALKDRCKKEIEEWGRQPAGVMPGGEPY